MENFLVNRDATFEIMRKKLAKAQEAMKRSADARRRDITFSSGDWVMVKLTPHRQSSMSQVPYSKLAKRFYGAYQILEKVGKVAYKLDLPTGSRIHLIVHCSILKMFKQSSLCPFLPLPTAAVNNQPMLCPFTIVSTKWVMLCHLPDCWRLCNGMAFPLMMPHGKTGKI